MSPVSMQTDPHKRWLKPAWFLSVAVHAALAAILFLRLPDARISPAEEVVPVELVEAPPEKTRTPPKHKAPRVQAKAAPPPAQSPPPAKQPSSEAKPEPVPQAAAFESASKDGDKKPPSAPEVLPPEKADPQPLSPPDLAEKANTDAPAAAGPAPQDQTAASVKGTPPPAEMKDRPAAVLPDLNLPEARRPTDESFDEPKAARTQSPVDPGPAAAVPQAKPAPPVSTIEPAKVPAARPAAATPAAPPLAKAKKLYSPDALSNPRLREALGTLSPDSRLVQVCSIEALEQIRHGPAGHVPDLFAAASPKGRQIDGNLLNASGGAFRSKGVWYDVGFSCTVDPKTYAVTGFRFAIGRPVPKSQWAAREFPRD